MLSEGAGYGSGQLTEKVVEWEMRNNRVYLRDVDFSINADPDAPIALAVKSANNDTIVMAFNVAAYHDGDPVIDVSLLYNTDVAEFSARQHIGATAFDASRSYVDRITPYPDNIEAEATATCTGAGDRTWRWSRWRNHARSQRDSGAAPQHGALA